jgi:hypothetical protein
MAVREQIAALLTYGVDGSAFGARTAIALTTTQVFTISQGFWLVELASASGGTQSLNFTPDAGVTTVTYIASGAAQAKAEIFADGFSWFVTNAGTASSVTLTQIKAMF